MGGAGWLFSIAILYASFPVAIKMYESQVKEDDITRELWKLCSVILPSAMFLFSAFFLTIKKEHRRTFWSTERGKDLSMRRFLNSTDDAVKADAIFPNTKKYWESIEDQVEDWVCENWKRWMEEEPKWLDDSMKASIPAHMIPNIEDQQKVKKMMSGMSTRSSLNL